MAPSPLFGVSVAGPGAVRPPPLEAAASAALAPDGVALLAATAGLAAGNVAIHFTKPMCCPLPLPQKRDGSVLGD